MVQKRKKHLGEHNCPSKAIMGCFPSLSWLSIVSKVFPPFHIQNTIIFNKKKIKKLFHSKQGLNPQPFNYQVNAQPIQPNHISWPILEFYDYIIIQHDHAQN